MEVNFVEVILAAVPGLLVAVFAWFKSHAAQSDAAWDDALVKFIESVAKGAVAGNTPPAAS